LTVHRWRLLDRFPKLRVAFLELGCEWVPFLAGRVAERYQDSAKRKILDDNARRFYNL
jgi:predicted TIM-barrel fold metal-dependent hydrolase